MENTSSNYFMGMGSNSPLNVSYRLMFESEYENLVRQNRDLQGRNTELVEQNRDLQSRNNELVEKNQLLVSHDRHTLNDLAKAIHKNAMEKGWWDNDRSFMEVAALIHSEISEAVEEYRDIGLQYWESNGNKPEGMAVELIDAVIRIFDYLAHYGYDIDLLMSRKMSYNKTRPYRHGGKKA